MRIDSDDTGPGYPTRTESRSCAHSSGVRPARTARAWALAIAQGFVEGHHGRLWIKDRVAAEPEPPSPCRSGIGRCESRRAILVVDDEPQIRGRCGSRCGPTGTMWRPSATGEEGLDARGRPSAGPGGPGPQPARHRWRGGMSGIREWSQLPIIVLSVRGDDDAKIRAFDEGADDYVTKPFSVPELLARMRVALRHAAAVTDGGEQLLRADELEIDLARRLVRRSGHQGNILQRPPSTRSFAI